MILSPQKMHSRQHLHMQSARNSHHANGFSNLSHRQFNSLLRKPPPEQPAPEHPRQPAATVSKPGGTTTTPKTTSTGNAIQHLFRSHTLNRSELKREKDQRLRDLDVRASLRRPKQNYQQSFGSGVASDLNNNSSNHNNSNIYAPASIAPPSEYSAKRQPSSQLFDHLGRQPTAVTNGYNTSSNNNYQTESQHYAATSCRGFPNYSATSAASESGRSGRESALGNLLGRFDTLRRKAKWANRWSKSAAGKTSKDPNNNNTNQYSNYNDPEIYAEGKRKKKLEAEEIYAEGSRAIDSNIQKRLLQHQINESMMGEGESRTLLSQESMHQPDYQELVAGLTNWINDELASQRIVVRDLQEDLHDGQILGRLVEKLHGTKLDLVEVTQNESAQVAKLNAVLSTINRILTLQARWAKIRWSALGIHSKNMVEIVQLLVALALYHRAPIRIPPSVEVGVFVIQKTRGELVTRSHQVKLTADASNMRLLRSHNGDLRDANHRLDAFDLFVQESPERLALVKRILINFVNRHLSKIGRTLAVFEQPVLDPEQFSDGLLLVLLISSLEDYFVPLGHLMAAGGGDGQSLLVEAASSAGRSVLSPPDGPDANNNYPSLPVDDLPVKDRTALEPDSYVNTQPIYKLHNVNLALQLIEDAGVQVRDRVRADDIVNGDLATLMRLLHALFSRYKYL